MATFVKINTMPEWPTTRDVRDVHLRWCMVNCHGDVRARHNAHMLYLEFEDVADALIYMMSAPKDDLTEEGFSTFYSRPFHEQIRLRNHRIIKRVPSRQSSVDS